MWALKKICITLTIFGLVWGVFGALPASGENVNQMLHIQILETPTQEINHPLSNETLMGLFMAVWISFIRVAGRTR